MQVQSSTRGGTQPKHEREREIPQVCNGAGAGLWVLALAVGWGGRPGGPTAPRPPSTHSSTQCWKSWQKMSGWSTSGDGVWSWKTPEKGEEKCKPCRHGQEHPVPGSSGMAADGTCNKKETVHLSLQPSCKQPPVSARLKRWSNLKDRHQVFLLQTHNKCLSIRI